MPRPPEGVSRAKAQFMREFVAALTAPPGNLMPAPGHAPLLREGASLRCADCHPGKDYDAKLPGDELGEDALERFRMDREGFMVPLMEKWVARLNKRHADRLAKEVTCADCHAVDPRDDGARRATFAPLMAAFVKALTEPPGNSDPATTWRPLLKSGESLSCAACHGREMELAPAPPSTGPVADRAFMIRLMERWVRELNRRTKDKLVKAVGCIDCHEIDPRK